MGYGMRDVGIGACRCWCGGNVRRGGNREGRIEGAEVVPGEWPRSSSGGYAAGGYHAGTHGCQRVLSVSCVLMVGVVRRAIMARRG